MTLCAGLLNAAMPLSYGGGITSTEEISRLFSIGYEKAILNTSFIRNPEMVREAVRLAGSQSIVVSIDAKADVFGRYSCYAADGTEKVGRTPADLASYAQELGAGEILLNSISHGSVDFFGRHPDADSVREEEGLENDSETGSLHGSVFGHRTSVSVHLRRERRYERRSRGFAEDLCGRNLSSDFSCCPSFSDCLEKTFPGIPLLQCLCGCVICFFLRCIHPGFHCPEF